MSLVRSTVVLLIVLFVGSAVGGVLASVADVYAAEAVAGTVLGPRHPNTAFAWTGVGIIVTETLRRWLL